jgi:DNA-damage-inducible protein J
MAQTSVNFRMDEQLKKNVEEICQKMGMSLTTALTVFCRKVEQERKIPFEITAEAIDPFYSESNMRYLKKKMEDYKAGRLNLVEHDLIEE